MPLSQSLAAAALSDSGRVVFEAALRGLGIDDSNRWRLWAAERGAALETVMREGDVAPGGAAGKALGAIRSDIVTNATGRIALSAPIRVGDSVAGMGLYTEDGSGALSLRLCGSGSVNLIDGIGVLDSSVVSFLADGSLLVIERLESASYPADPFDLCSEPALDTALAFVPEGGIRSA